ncbi:MAG: hypothetical protein GC129_02025 [Proteobacteria bacterium]|nr:hypothetical protein [Pseudomonadota bacterium]
MVAKKPKNLKTFIEETPEAQPSSKDMTFIQFIMSRIKLVVSTSDHCDGAFVEVTDKDGTLLHPASSEQVKHYLHDLYDCYEGKKKTEMLTKGKLEEVIDYINAKAASKGKKRLVFKRLGWLSTEKALVLDLGQPDGSFAHVDAKGWGIAKNTSPIFARYNNQRPLAVPQPVSEEEGYEAFRKMLPPSMTPQQVKLLLGGVLGYLIPNNFTESFTYPLLVMRGQPGSGKSTVASTLKKLLDNEKAVISTTPHSIRDLFVVGKRSHLLSFDNLDNLKGDISDALCQATSGGDRSMRALYTNDETSTLKMHSPIMLNGIGEIIRRQDIVDRSITINLLRIKDYSPYAAEKAQAYAPQALGYILSLLAKALANLENTPNQGNIRLATVAHLVSAAEPFGYTEKFTELLHANQRETLMSVDENHPIIEHLLLLLNKHEKWSGTYKELLQELSSEAGYGDCTKTDEWPKTPKRLSNFLHHRQLLLSELGIDIKQGVKKNNGRVVHLSRNKNFVCED